MRHKPWLPLYRFGEAANEPHIGYCPVSNTPYVSYPALRDAIGWIQWAWERRDAPGPTYGMEGREEYK